MTKKPTDSKKKQQKQQQESEESIDNSSEENNLSDQEEEIIEERQSQKQPIKGGGCCSSKFYQQEDQKGEEPDFDENQLKESIKNLTPEQIKERINQVWEKKLYLYLKQEKLDINSIDKSEKEHLINQLKNGKIKIKSTNEEENVKKGGWDSLIIFLFLILLLFGMAYMKYHEINYNKTTKVHLGNYNDLYEVLELDSSASQADIKRSYKKLAKLWHPDLNPDCKDCSEKFNNLAQAYEVLGKEESRDQYDQTRGVTEAITSQAIQLTTRNFQNLVMESNDVWIIQVYENSSKLCKQLAPFWESAVGKYQHIIKFGRINRETDPYLLQYLPINIAVVPTTLSLVNRGEHSNMYIFDRKNPEGSMFKFVVDSIISKVNIFGAPESEELYNKLTQKSHNNNKVDIVYFAQQPKLPIEIKYSALKLEDAVNIHVSKQKDYKKVQYYFGKTQDNFFIFYNDLVTGQRKQLSFRFPGKFDPQLYKKFLKLAKFVSVPYLDRANFKDFCENIQLRADEYDEDYGQQNLCIVINSQEPKVLKEIERVREEQVQDMVKILKSHNNSDQQLFESFSQIMFVQIDYELHWKFQKSLTQLYNNPFPFDKANLFAILAENRKVSISQNVISIEDWILDLFDNDGNNLEYLNDYLPEDLKNLDISAFFKFKNQDIVNMGFTTLKKTIKDWKTYITSILVYIGGRKLFTKKSTPNSTFVLFLVFIFVVIISTAFELYEEFMQ